MHSLGEYCWELDAYLFGCILGHVALAFRETLRMCCCIPSGWRLEDMDGVPLLWWKLYPPAHPHSSG